MTHVDDWILNKCLVGTEAEKYAAFVLHLARLPAAMNLAFLKIVEQHSLFCTFKGKTWRVTGASRFGDVWLASNLQRESGYDCRVNIDDCSDWSPEPKSLDSLSTEEFLKMLSEDVNAPYVYPYYLPVGDESITGKKAVFTGTNGSISDRTLAREHGLVPGEKYEVKLIVYKWDSYVAIELKGKKVKFNSVMFCAEKDWVPTRYRSIAV